MSIRQNNHQKDELIDWWIEAYNRPSFSKKYTLTFEHFPIQQRILFKILILTYQAYHKTAPQYLCDLIMPYSNARNLRSDNMSLIAPCHPRAKLKSYGERSFQHAAPTEWNKLPLLIRESPSLDIFETQLKTFLFKSILEP